MKQPIPFFLPYVDQEEEEAVQRVLRSGWLSSGREVLAFEKEFSSVVKSPYCLAVNSGTAGLHLALASLQLPAGSKVALSPYTFAASATTIIHSGLEPVFVDITSDGFNIDVDALSHFLQSAALRKDIRALMPVHISGLSCDMDAILELANTYKLKVVEDAAHAFPAREASGACIGTRGDAGVFSFYANKTMVCGEGGMLVTRDADLANRADALRLHGMIPSSWDRYTNPNKKNAVYDIVAAGFKYNLSDILASIGRVQLQKSEKMQQIRCKIAQQYIQALSDRDYLTVPEYCKAHSWHLFIIRLRLDRLNIDRDSFNEKLRSKDIATSIHFRPLHLMSFFEKRYHLKPEDFPNALSRYQEVISLPIFPAMTEEMVERVCQALTSIGDKHYSPL